jgi:hypothetical protein
VVTVGGREHFLGLVKAATLLVSKASLAIEIDRSDRKLRLTQTPGRAVTTLLAADIVSGCEDSGTPVGIYRAGKWIKDKTNASHGPKPWSHGPLRRIVLLTCR